MKCPRVNDGVIKGIPTYKISAPVNLLIWKHSTKCITLNSQKLSIQSTVWSMTSVNEIVREQQALDRNRRLCPEKTLHNSHLENCLSGEIPVVIASDYIRHCYEGLRAGISSPLTILGTDGFGSSDTRSKLRKHFEVDAASIAYAALVHRFRSGKITKEALLKHGSS